MEANLEACISQRSEDWVLLAFGVGKGDRTAIN